VRLRNDTAQAHFIYQLVNGTRRLKSLIAEHAPRARHVLEQYANNVVEADHGRLKARLRPMRGPKTIAARTIAAGHAFVQNLRRSLRDHRRPAVHDRGRIAFRPDHTLPLTASRRSRDLSLRSIIERNGAQSSAARFRWAAGSAGVRAVAPLARSGQWGQRGGPAGLESPRDAVPFRRFR
jgi:hypothetical protein